MNTKTTIISVITGSLLTIAFGSDLTTRSLNSHGFLLKNQEKSLELAERGSGRREQKPQPNFLVDRRLG